MDTLAIEVTGEIDVNEDGAPTKAVVEVRAHNLSDELGESIARYYLARQLGTATDELDYLSATVYNEGHCVNVHFDGVNY